MTRKTNNEKRNKMQTFSITAPAAQSVQLVGDFTHWQDRPINLHKEGNGVWRASVELERGEHHYRFLLDGQWCDDPGMHRGRPESLRQPGLGAAGALATKTRINKRKVAEAAVGAVIGGAIAGPIGVVAGGLAAGHVDSGFERLGKLKRPKGWSDPDAEDPVVHARLRRILVPLDFSLPSRRALRFAREWAILFGAEVCLLHVLEATTAVAELAGVREENVSPRKNARVVTTTQVSGRSQ